MSYPVTAPTPRDSIRSALREDAGEIACLFLISSDGLTTYLWSRMRMPGLSLEEIGAARAAAVTSSAALAKDSVGPAYSPSSLSDGWSSGLRPSAQRYLLSLSRIGKSLMLARRRRIRPCSSNSQFSFP